jgi:hypothetical protein
MNKRRKNPKYLTCKKEKKRKKGRKQEKEKGKIIE